MENTNVITELILTLILMKNVEDNIVDLSFEPTKNENDMKLTCTRQQ